MITVIQRVSKASVTVEGQITGSIGAGLLVYIGIEKGDTDRDAQFTASKLAGLRIFTDDNGKMNLNVKQINGSVLAISNFTLCGNCRKGRRPSYDNAAMPAEAEPLFDMTVEHLRGEGLTVETGIFGAHMDVSSIADGPVNLVLSSH